MSRSLRRPVLLLAAAGGLLTCGEGPSGATRRVTTVLTSRASVHIEVGASVVVGAEGRGGGGGRGCPLLLCRVAPGCGGRGRRLGGPSRHDGGPRPPADHRHDPRQ